MNLNNYRQNFLLVLALGLAAILISQPVKAQIFAVPDLFSIETRPSWEKLEKHIRESSDVADVLLWSGYGGRSDDAFKFLEFLENEQSIGKKFVFIVHGLAASNHAFILCFIDNVEFASDNVVMFHSYGIVSVKNGKEDFGSRYRTDNEETEKIYQECIKSGKMTEQDRLDITTGKKEVYIHFNADGTVKSRITKHDSRPTSHTYGDDL